MTVRHFARSATMLAVGYAVTGGVFWLLLIVPESSVIALLGSLFLFVLTAACAGFTTGAAVAVAQGTSGFEVPRRATAAFPGFLLGVAILGLLQWITSAVDAWWMSNRGEIDAVILRYAGLTKTEPLHVTLYWLTWLTRWGVGLSLLASLVAAGNARRTIGSGLRAGLRLIPLASTAAGTVLVSEGLWRLAYWRPAGLPPSRTELLFVVVKLGLLYLLAVLVATVVLGVHRWVAGRAAAT